MLTGYLGKQVIKVSGREINTDQPSEETLRLMYQLFIDGIKQAKKQQWRIVYYVFLLQAAIVAGLEKILNGRYLDNNILVFLGGLMSFGAAACCNYFIVKYEGDMARYREKKMEIGSKLKFEKESTIDEDHDVKIMFIAVSSISCIFVLFILIGLAVNHLAP